MTSTRTDFSWEFFTIDGEEYRRRQLKVRGGYGDDVEWQKGKMINLNNPTRNFGPLGQNFVDWTYVNNDYKIALENMYQEFIYKESRLNKLKRIIGDNKND
jgi:hypothetical protein